MLRLNFLLNVIIVFFIFFQTAEAKADSGNAESDLVQQANKALDLFSFRLKRQIPSFQTKLNLSRGVLLCPDLKISSNLLMSNAKGKCLLFSRDSQNGWSAPAFYDFSQRGAFTAPSAETDLIFFVMTQKALEAFIDNDVFLKNKRHFSILPFQKNTYQQNPDFYVSHFSGKESEVEISKLNAAISFSPISNKNYYHSALHPTDILLLMKVNNPQSDNVRRTLMALSH